MKRILAISLLALMLSACVGTSDTRQNVADRMLGETTSNECRAIRAVSLVEVAARTWPHQDWAQAMGAAALMVEHAKSQRFDVVADNFALTFYAPLAHMALERGLRISAAGMLLRAADLLNRLPGAAAALVEVRAAVAKCEVTMMGVKS